VITSGPANDAIQLYSLTSGKESKIPFWFAGTSVIWIEDVGVAQNGDFLVAGAFLRPTDTAPSYFIAEIDSSGKTIATVASGSFSPMLVCGSNDGTIWAFGQDWDAAGAGRSYSMLRNYSVDGQLLRTYLERKDLSVGRLNFSARLHYAGGLPGLAFLRCGDTSVGAYVGPARTWVEVRLADGTSQLWHVSLPSAQTAITGLAFMNNGSVFSSLITADPGLVNQKEGLYVLDLSQESSATWRPVPGTVAPASLTGTIRILLGSDKSSFVYVKNHVTSENGSYVLFWSKP
jgi:hypothetical protein